MKKPLAAFALSLLFAASPALAARLPNLDLRAAAPARAGSVAPGPGAAPPAFVAAVDEKRGVPTFVWASRPGSPPPQGSQGLAGQVLSPELAARQHLVRHAALYGLGAEALAAAGVIQVHDTGRGGIVVVFRQQSAGVELFHTDLKVLMTRSLELVALGGNLHHAASPQLKPGAFPAAFDERHALAAAFGDLYGLPVAASSFVDQKRSKASFRYFELMPTAAIAAQKLQLSVPARVKKVLFPMPDRLVPAYFLELLAGRSDQTDGDAYAYVIAAEDGRVLYRENLTHSDAFQYRVFASAAGDKRPLDGPLADFNPHPTGVPDGSYPAFLAPSLISIDGFNKNPQNQGDPWLPAGAGVSTGNNVDAYTDNDAPDGFSPGDIRATTTSAGVFDRAYNVNAGPQSSQNQKMASVTDLFYVNNWLHDWWYDSGFDEAAGNAQQDNFGRGGVAGDPIHAEAQDGAPQKRNNSDMTVVGDGEPPKMQMYVWDPRPGTNFDIDGTIDNSVVAHEWGHYLHLRLVACGSAFCSAESEGWADFNAIMMTLRPGDAQNGTYAVAQYATGAFTDPGYFGIRRYPYSTSLAKSPLTFKHIQQGQALPANVPSSVLSFDNSEPHNAGEVWAVMLFEGYVALRAKAEGPNPPYAVEEAHRRMGDYVVAGMKLAPADPTFLEQRDGILAAAAAADQADLVSLAQAFAKRGAGTCAISPPRDSQDFVGVVESFEVKANVEITGITLDDSQLSCDQDGVLDAGETGLVTVKVMNIGTALLAGATVTVSSSNPAASFPNGPTGALPGIPPYGTGQATIPISLASSLAKETSLALHVTAAVPGGCAGTPAFDSSPLVNDDIVPASSASDDVEAQTSLWTPAGKDQDKIWSRLEATPGNHAWRGTDFGSPSDTALVSPPLQVDPVANLVIAWKHRYRFETSMGVFWDGGVVEISDDAGANWHDLGQYGNAGYTGKIGDPQNQAKNVLKDRQGFVDQSPGYPALTAKSVNLGNNLAGKTIQVRFRIGTDDAAGDFGWEIDDLSFSGITNTPFTALIDDMTPCGGSSSSSSGGGGGAGGAGGAGGSGGMSTTGTGGAGTTSTTTTTTVTTAGTGGMSTTGTGGAGTTTTTSVGQGGSGVGGAQTSGAGGAGGSRSDGPSTGIVFGGCGCTVGDTPAGAPQALPLLGLASLALRRRRRAAPPVTGGR